MKVYLAQTELVLEVPLTDASGNLLNVDAIEYRITDEQGTELLAQTALTKFVAGGEVATVSVSGALNTLAANVTRGARVIELHCAISGGTTLIRHTYAIEVADVLVAGGNSFQTLAQADLLSLSMPNIDGWNVADDQSRIAALTEAHRRICTLPFSNLNEANQTHLSLTIEEYLSLSLRFRNALCLAQVAEANTILGGDVADARRQEGLVMDVVGESRQQWRPTKPIDIPVCKRALQYLGGYISFSMKIGRG